MPYDNDDFGNDGLDDDEGSEKERSVIPNWSEISDPKHEKQDLKILWREAFADNEFFENIKPHITNGGVYGEQKYDEFAVWNLFCDWDIVKGGGRLKALGIKAKDVRAAVNVGFRGLAERYEIGKKRKLIGTNKRL